MLLRTYRKRAGLKQEELAEQLGIAASTLCSWEKGHKPIDASKIEKIGGYLDLADAEKTRLMFLCLPALDPAWLTKQVAESRTGLLLDAYLKRGGMLQENLAPALDISISAVSQWLSGKRAVDPGKLDAIANRLDLSAADTQRLIQSRLPAFDPSWLNAQEAPVRAGLLLNACRERLGWNQQTLADKMEVSLAQLREWEKGKRPIPEASVAQLSDFFKDLSGFDPAAFRATAVASNQAIASQIMNKRYVGLSDSASAPPTTQVGVIGRLGHLLKPEKSGQERLKNPSSNPSLG